MEINIGKDEECWTELYTIECDINCLSVDCLSKKILCNNCIMARGKNDFTLNELTSLNRLRKEEIG